MDLHSLLSWSKGFTRVSSIELTFQGLVQDKESDTTVFSNPLMLEIFLERARMPAFASPGRKFLADGSGSSG